MQAEVYREQTDVFGENLSRFVTSDDLKLMNYLEKVIKETLRLYPSVPFVGREVSDDDTYYKGVKLPKGLTLTLFLYRIHRNPEFFPDPEKFDPDRFDHIDGRRPFSYLAFSAGPRNCIGTFLDKINIFFVKL